MILNKLLSLLVGKDVSEGGGLVCKLPCCFLRALSQMAGRRCTCSPVDSSTHLLEQRRTPSQPPRHISTTVSAVSRCSHFGRPLSTFPFCERRATFVFCWFTGRETARGPSPDTPLGVCENLNGWMNQQPSDLLTFQSRNNNNFKLWKMFQIRTI
jgi:hypothetical protein